MRFVPNAIAFGVGAYVAAWAVGTSEVLAVGMLIGALYISFLVWMEDHEL